MRGAINNPGELSHLLVLQKCERVADGLGGQSENWVKLRNVWARVSLQSQREVATGDHLAGELNYEVLIRYRDDIEVGMRFVFRDQNLEIQSCADIAGDQCFLVCLCQEIK
ncbi:MAG: phage head closure protein [Hyphomicrobiales bacterium]